MRATRRCTHEKTQALNCYRANSMLYAIRRKKPQKKFEKRLDILQAVLYNIITARG